MTPSVAVVAALSDHFHASRNDAFVLVSVSRFQVNLSRYCVHPQGFVRSAMLEQEAQADFEAHDLKVISDALVERCVELQARTGAGDNVSAIIVYLPPLVD